MGQAFVTVASQLDRVGTLNAQSVQAGGAKQLALTGGGPTTKAASKAAAAETPLSLQPASQAPIALSRDEVAEVHRALFAELMGVPVSSVELCLSCISSAGGIWRLPPGTSGASGKRYRSCCASCGQNPGRKQDIAHSAACSQKQAQAWNGMSMCPLSPAVNAAVMAELTKRLAAAAAGTAAPGAAQMQYGQMRQQQQQQQQQAMQPPPAGQFGLSPMSPSPAQTPSLAKAAGYAPNPMQGGGSYSRQSRIGSWNWSHWYGNAGCYGGLGFSKDSSHASASNSNSSHNK